MSRFALGLAYDGSSFTGWQTQPSRDAVQDVLERSLALLAGHSVATICAGRTDAGVHALNQVVHFQSDARRSLQAWVRGVNARLPAAVRVCWAREVVPEFHARFSAQTRTYRYLLGSGPIVHPLWYGRAGWVWFPLSLEAMRAAARCLLGEHDFSSLRSAQCQAASPVRTLHRLEIERYGDFYEFTVVGNAFLHHMVRNIMGLLVWVGAGRRAPEWAAQVLAARSRRLAPPTFSPAGLYFCGATYDPRFGLPDVSLHRFDVFPSGMASSSGR